MKALLLAAGYGTRLRPLTDTIPKALVPIKGEPLLGIWLDRLVAAGHGPFLVNTHYLPDQVRMFVAHSSHTGCITLVHETQLRGTAGTLIDNLKFFDGKDGFLIHADNYCLADLCAFTSAHLERPVGCVMTMMTFRTDFPQSCGIVELDERGVVTAFHEKVENPPGNLANGAVYILSPEMLTLMMTQFRGVSDFSTQVIPYLIGQIYSHECKNAFMDVGTPAAYERANQLP